MVKQRNSKNGFMFKLKSILLNNKYSEILQINLDKNGFIIHDLDKFKNQVLKENYRHTNFNSFRRSLNLYGFSSKKYKKRKILYMNPNFNINAEELLRIQIRPAEIQDFKSELIRDYNTLYDIRESQKKIMQQVQQLIEAQNILHQKIQRQYLAYLKERIFQRIRFRKLERFCFSFYFNIQDQKYKKIIERSLVIVAKTLSQSSESQMILDTYNLNQQQETYQQQFSMYLDRNLLSNGNSKALSNSPGEFDLNQSFSALSNYFEF
ncbi:unnamed protein product (macronuclear) [Paramecium tetraurelia]|uniref:HSF-type DNA-binding domain-containing protein n=1 Tax=Paramecium tetraurelia TaxID=5888 RepID=A0D3D0_PARTE|nr:uncharacterized protein GSPATT00013033001 [Paramecium tetraurelia]CAK77547.1 unnamed protein product [Paramecium tetraurelia]|eukprot:XP_001444944.1 hypothetical protein (macronuclear) [Paramecium tetraurelia strain d4-2]